MTHNANHFGDITYALIFSLLAACGTGSGVSSTLGNNLDAGDIASPADVGQSEDVSPPDSGSPVDSTSPPDPDTADPTPIGPAVGIYCAQAASALCDRLYGCSDQTPAFRARLESEYGFDDANTCRQTLSKQLTDACQTAAIGVQKGRATYKPAAAADCLGQLRSASCASLAEGAADLRGRTIFQPAFCDDISVAQQQSSEDCLADSDCMGTDAYCSEAVYGADQVTRTGQCSSRAAAGSGCSVPTDCTDGTYCNSGTCATFPTEGDPCTTVCGQGLKCNGQTDTCERPGGVSDPCQSSLDCQSDLFCDHDTDACQPPPGAGESCVRDCQPGYYCGFESGTCDAMPTDGDPCTNGCASGFECSANSTCVATPVEGDSCASLECLDGLVCRADDTTCAVPALIDESCQSDDDCIWYATCSGSNLCQPRPALGQSCTDDCLDPWTCSAGTCVDPQGAD